RDEKRTWRSTPEKLSETLAYAGEKVFKFSMNNCREWIRILIPEKLADTLKTRRRKNEYTKENKILPEKSARHFYTQKLS
ncbi:MAG: hypothetical protein Satyrvirus14_19, partial [Satyrvirus sp.]